MNYLVNLQDNLMLMKFVNYLYSKLYFTENILLQKIFYSSRKKMDLTNYYFGPLKMIVRKSKKI